MPSVRDLVEELRRLADQLATDAAGLALLDTETTPRTSSLDRGVEELFAAHERLSSGARILRRERRAWLARQLARLALPAKNLRLSLTGARVPGWLSIGFPPAELVMDLRWGLPFASGAADRIYFALALEHLVYPDDALAVLRDLRRVLAPGGVLRVVVPDLEVYLRAYVAGDFAMFMAHDRWFPWAKHARTSLDVITALVGSGLARGPKDHDGHKTGYDWPTLAHVLRTAGFTSIERRAYQESPYPELCIDDTSADAHLAYEGRSLNLFVEAR